MVNNTNIRKKPSLKISSRISCSIFIFFCIISTLLLIPRWAHAVGSAGFENATLSTRTLAKGNAAVADPKDPSTIAYNPAGLPKLEGTQVYSGASILGIATEYEGSEGRTVEKSSEVPITIPYFYFSTPTSTEGLSLGIGMNSPFGLASKWSSEGNFRYIAYFTELKSVAKHLSVGYEVLPWLSIGGGYTYMDVRLKQNGRFNSPVLVGDPDDSDFELDVEGHGHGYNLGLLLTPNERHTLGVFYRGEIVARMKGVMSTDRLGTVMQVTFGTNGSTTHLTDADTDYTFPANVTVGYQYSPNDKWDLEADIGWTNWSGFDSVNIAFGEANGVLDGFKDFDKDYRDSISIHTGFTHRLNEFLNLMAGSYFFSRAENKNNYSNENADGHRLAATAGLELHRDNWSIDVMYQFIHVFEVEISNTKGGTNGTDIDGRYSGNTQILTTGLKYVF